MQTHFNTFEECMDCLCCSLPSRISFLPLLLEVSWITMMKNI